MPRLARLLAWRNISYSVVEYLSILLFLIAFTLALYGNPAFAALTYLIATSAWHLARHCAALAVGGRSIAQALGWAAVGTFLAIPVSMAWFDKGEFGSLAPFILAGWLISAWLLTCQARKDNMATPQGHYDAAGYALILAIGGFLGFALWAMGAVIAILVVEQAWKNHKGNTIR
jgi:hypothetical protein